MKVNARQNIQLHFLPSSDFHVVMLRDIDDILPLCFSRTAVVVPVSVNACTQYPASGKVDAEKTNFDFVTVITTVL